MKVFFKSYKQQITVTAYAKQTGLDVIEIYAMIDAGEIKSTKKGKRTMILL